ncbi:transferase [Pseudomonas sp. BF61]|uniref:transferase n=1 Tax=Pseudomonas sp. BF61 TaxID=2741068 RepID=UPI001C0CC012|nr:transferase [Pseudomonas sp. BF61]MBU4626638.1 transferase [Pseudomonas sp. BF61]
MKIYLLDAKNPESIRTLHAVHLKTPHVEFAFLDDDLAKHHTSFYGTPIVGALDLVAQLKGPDTKFVNLMSDSPYVRHEVTKKVIKTGGALGNLIHPDVDLTSVKMGIGNYIQAAVFLQMEVSIGNNSCIHARAFVGYRSHIGDSVIIAHGATVSKHCKIGDECFIGINATILPYANIGNGVTIGAGAVVSGDIPDDSLVLSNCAKVIKNNFLSL